MIITCNDAKQKKIRKFPENSNFYPPKNHGEINAAQHANLCLVVWDPFFPRVSINFLGTLGNTWGLLGIYVNLTQFYGRFGRGLRCAFRSEPKRNFRENSPGNFVGKE